MIEKFQLKGGISEPSSDCVIRNPIKIISEL
jgi:hypothetical protein